MAILRSKGRYEMLHLPGTAGVEASCMQKPSHDPTSIDVTGVVARAPFNSASHASRLSFNGRTFAE